MEEVYRENVLQLMQQKDKIEEEIKQLTSILTKSGIGMTEPLVDVEGFPLNNIDIYQVRHARQKIICLQNDHKNIMKQIEAGLHTYHTSSPNKSEVKSNSNENTSIGLRQQYQLPFAKVTIVTPGSPAAYAGLEMNDLIVEFGSLNATNFTNIIDISNIVKHSEGHHLNIKLKRGERYIVTQLLPKRWNGRGLLGCNIVTLT